MADTKYLQKRKGVWFIRVPRPPKSWGLGVKEFLHSLKTSELKHAQRLRDKYLLPILAEDSALKMVEEVARLLARAEPEIRERLRQLGIALGEDGAFTLGDLVKKFLDAAAKSDYKPATLKTFRSTLAAFTRIVGADLDIQEMKKQQVLEFRDTLAGFPANWMLKGSDTVPVAQPGEKLVSPRTIAGFLRRLNRVFAWAIDEDLLVGDNPIAGVKMTFTRNPARQELTVAEADLLLAMSYPPNQNVDAVAWKYMPLIARYTGARLAEIGQLRREDIVEQEGILCLSIGTTGGRTVKTESSIRLVPVADKLLPHVRELMQKVKHGRLFPRCGDWKDDDGYVQVGHGFKIWVRHAKAIGAHVTFHAWRHYAVTQMANAGVSEIDRMRIVGHVASGTHAVYTSANLQRYKEAVNKIP